MNQQQGFPLLVRGLEFLLSLRVLGQVLLASGRHGLAMAAFEQSLSLLADRNPYEAACTKTRWGLALVSGGDADRGKILLQEARAAFRELDAKRDLAAVNQALRITD
jgi:hypothetical protein